MGFKTDQENFWAGSFGDDYISRNQEADILAGNTALFSQVLKCTSGIGSVIEFGANIGLNLIALKGLLPQSRFAGIEINDSAVESLKALEYVDAHHQSILDYEPSRRYDLVLSKTVLIHVAPDCLPAVYGKLHASTRRYICLAEYYNPSPMEVTYRGHAGKLFKRDFAGDMLMRFPDLRLAGYGFCYRHDPVFPMDDITWFLLEKMTP